MIIAIVAIAQNLAIGRDGKLPWHYPADLKFFKEATMGSAIVMGSNTWRAIGRPLPGRLNIVLSRSGNVETPPQVMRLHSSDEVTTLAPYLNCDIYIIGGARTYAEFADDIGRWVVTDVPLTVDDADTFMPVNFLDGFTETESRDLEYGLRVRFLDRS